MPNQYADESGIFAKWGDACNVGIDFAMATDYISSIEAYVAGKADGVTMTNMEALNFAGTAGIDTTAVVIGDFSDGNDAVLTRGLGLCDLKGQKIFLVELSVSHYMLARGLQKECKGVTESDLRLINTSDSDIGPAFLADTSQKATVTWNPIKLQVLSQDSSVKSVFESSQIPGEISDIIFVRTEMLREHPEVGVAIAGAWYEVMTIMNSSGPERDQALTAMAQASGDTLDSYKKQLETTHMFWTPQFAVAFTSSSVLIQTMDLVRNFSFDHGLYGQGAKSADAVGIQFPGGTVLGDRNNIKLRFTTEYMAAIK